MPFSCFPLFPTLTLQHRIQENESLSLRPHDENFCFSGETRETGYTLLINHLKHYDYGIF